GVIFSSPKFITPKYKSVAVVYPSNISPYSDESESEQLFQWFLSSDIKWQVIEKYNLYEHYGIEKGSPKSLAYIINEYDNNVKIEQNSYDAISITVFDRDPQIACDMVNSIIDFLNINIRKIHKEKFGEVVPIYEKTIERSLAQSAKLTEEIVEIGASNDLLFYISKALGITSKKANNSSSIGYIDSVGPEYLNSILQLMAINGSLETLLGNYNIAYANLQKEFSYTNMLSHPYVADKKSTPVRWIIVLFSGIAAFMLSYVAFICVENIPNKKEEE
ncbi:hypothetical protein LJC25_02615, partial [Bacteroidales bacterium OttesenSCG-928-K03]|nr:hypothetical protein [Bacteroidales bacterium OttesenSCG-928-K03]